MFAQLSGPLSASDIENVRVVLERARHSATFQEFLDKVNLAKFSSDAQREKCEAFRVQLKAANKGVDVGDEQLWKFLKCFHLLGFDLDITSGVTLSLLNSHIAKFKCGDVAAFGRKLQRSRIFKPERWERSRLKLFQKKSKLHFPNMRRSANTKRIFEKS